MPYYISESISLSALLAKPTCFELLGFLRLQTDTSYELCGYALTVLKKHIDEKLRNILLTSVLRSTDERRPVLNCSLQYKDTFLVIQNCSEI